MHKHCHLAIYSHSRLCTWCIGGGGGVCVCSEWEKSQMQ